MNSNPFTLWTFDGLEGRWEPERLPDWAKACVLPPGVIPRERGGTGWLHGRFTGQIGGSLCFSWDPADGHDFTPDETH